MNVTDAVLSRRSVRAFLDTPVPSDALNRVMDKARWAPSGCNYQPWEATILTGEPLRALQDKMVGATFQSPAEYVVIPPELEELYKARLAETGARMYGSKGIARDDKEERAAQAIRNFRSYGAPVVLMCHFPRYMGPPQWSDVGMWLQTIMLLLREEGLDSCAQEYLSFHAKLIKEHIGVDDATELFFCGLAIGYRDDSDFINNFDRPRAPLDDLVKFVGF